MKFFGSSRNSAKEQQLADLKARFPGLRRPNGDSSVLEVQFDVNSQFMTLKVLILIKSYPHPNPNPNPNQNQNQNPNPNPNPNPNTNNILKAYITDAFPRERPIMQVY